MTGQRKKNWLPCPQTRQPCDGDRAESYSLKTHTGGARFICAARFCLDRRARCTCVRSTSRKISSTFVSCSHSMCIGLCFDVPALQTSLTIVEDVQLATCQFKCLKKRYVTGTSELSLHLGCPGFKYEQERVASTSYLCNAVL